MNNSENNNDLNVISLGGVENTDESKSTRYFRPKSES